MFICIDLMDAVSLNVQKYYHHTRGQLARWQQTQAGEDLNTGRPGFVPKHAVYTDALPERRDAPSPYVCAEDMVQWLSSVISSRSCFKTQWLLCAPPVQVQVLYCTVYKSGYCVLRQYKYKCLIVQRIKVVTVCSSSTSTSALLYSAQKWLLCAPPVQVQVLYCTVYKSG
jgi:hypothetical protein